MTDAPVACTLSFQRSGVLEGVVSKFLFFVSTSLLIPNGLKCVSSYKLSGEYPSVSSCRPRCCLPVHWKHTVAGNWHLRGHRAQLRRPSQAEFSQFGWWSRFAGVSACVFILLIWFLRAIFHGSGSRIMSGLRRCPGCVGSLSSGGEGVAD